jgi:hypothetical protein
MQNSIGGNRRNCRLYAVNCDVHKMFSSNVVQSKMSWLENKYIPLKANDHSMFLNAESHNKICIITSASIVQHFYNLDIGDTEINSVALLPIQCNNSFTMQHAS